MGVGATGQGKGGWRQWADRSSQLQRIQETTLTAVGPLGPEDKTKQKNPVSMHQGCLHPEAGSALGQRFGWHRNRFWIFLLESSSKSPLLPSKGTQCPFAVVLGEECSRPLQALEKQLREKLGEASTSTVITAAVNAITIPIRLLL